MTEINTAKRIVRSKKGQVLFELTFIVPIMLALVYGAVEIGQMISAYLTITHTTREGANLTSRGTLPNTALDAVIGAAAPIIRSNNLSQWRVIYSKITQQPGIPCPPKPCHYRVESQILRGNWSQTSRIGLPNGSDIIIPGLQDVDPGQTFHAMEVFLDYTPNVVTYIGTQFMDKNFYERTIFTNVE
jgi:hypothetical protein